jgi:glucose/mannose-6-phosphate isomerase
LITQNDLEQLDTKKVHKIYDMWPKISRDSYFSNIPKINLKKCSHIIFAGMGGSGTIGDIFFSILSKTDTHVTVVKGYNLPRTVNTESLVVITSVSGNTIETISLLENAEKIGAKIIAFSDGGKIKDICLKNNIEHRNIKKYHSPRASFTSFLYSMLQVLKPILPINESDVLESLEKLEIISKKCNSNNISMTNPSIQISEWLDNFPIIYFPFGLQSVAIRFKNAIQENAKTHVLIEDVIESSHNGIVGWNKKSKFQPILLQGKDDVETTKERWTILKEFFKLKNIDYKEIISEEGNILTKIICLIYVLDYSSIFLAIKLKVDPSPVMAIDFIKKRLNQNPKIIE